MNEYPKMLYRAGGTEEIHGHQLATITVHDEDEERMALADGWHLTSTEAVDADKTARAGGTSDDNGPPTRDELKAKAAELGLTYKHNISNAALAELVATALPKE